MTTTTTESPTITRARRLNILAARAYAAVERQMDLADAAIGDKTDEFERRFDRRLVLFARYLRLWDAFMAALPGRVRRIDPPRGSYMMARETAELITADHHAA